MSWMAWFCGCPHISIKTLRLPIRKYFQFYSGSFNDTKTRFYCCWSRVCGLCFGESPECRPCSVRIVVGSWWKRQQSTLQNACWFFSLDAIGQGQLEL